MSKVSERNEVKLRFALKKSNAHAHLNPVGHLEMCYHKCRSMSTVGFWVGLTLGFPLEHLLWEKVPGFSNITQWMGL